MNVLVLDKAARAEISRVKAHAEANHYTRGGPVPGNDPAFVAHIGRYRVVFTITRDGDLLLRHLTVSVPGNKYPNPAAAFAIADAFGFTGWDESVPAAPPSDWVFGPHNRERCVVVVQRLNN